MHELYIALTCFLGDSSTSKHILVENGKGKQKDSIIHELNMV